MIGNLICVARSTARVIFSPTTSPMLPIMKSAPMTAITTSFPRIFPFPVIDRFIKIRYGALAFQFILISWKFSWIACIHPLHPILQKYLYLIPCNSCLWTDSKVIATDWTYIIIFDQILIVYRLPATVTLLE